MPDRDGSSDIEALRVTRTEYRAVVDHQIALMNDLDSKAMWTARTAIILLGLLLSAGGITGRPVLAGLPTGAKFAFGFGSLSLITTILIGVGTYTASMPRFGVDASHHREVMEGDYTEREWLGLMLDEYEKWNGELGAAVAADARQVFVTQLILLGSLVALLLGVSFLALGL